MKMTLFYINISTRYDEENVYIISINNNWFANETQIKHYDNT